MGWCPSGRLFEAAACGTPILSDWWEGLDTFFVPGEEIMIAQTTEDTLAVMNHGNTALTQIGQRARDRALEEHTARARVRELLRAFEGARTGQRLAV